VARTRLSVEERQADLLRAAVEQIEQRGVAELRIADVAKALGVSNALVIYHFETKEKLVAAAFAYAAEADLDHLRRLLARPTSAERRIRAALRWYSPTGKAKGWRLWIEGWAVSLREPTLREVSADLDRRWREALVAVLEEGVAGGEFSCPDPTASAARLTALIDGLAVRMTVHPGLVSRAATDAWVDDALARELGLGGAG
jgi:AcrR family transcriptional regulator